MNFTGCFLRVLENTNTVCILCDSAAVDLENITVCTYSKDSRLTACWIVSPMFGSFVLTRLFLCFLDYTLERKNHTTVTTVVPKIGKTCRLISCGVIFLAWLEETGMLDAVNVCQFIFCFCTVFLCRWPWCGSLSTSGNAVDQPLPDTLCRLLFLPQTLQPTSKYLLSPQQG